MRELYLWFRNVNLIKEKFFWIKKEWNVKKKLNKIERSIKKLLWNLINCNISKDLTNTHNMYICIQRINGDRGKMNSESS